MTIKYLIFSLLCYLISEILGLVFFIAGDTSAELNSSDIYELILSILILSTLLITFFLLRLFLESYDYERILNRNNIVLGTFVVIALTGYFITTIIGIFSVYDIIDGFYSQNTKLQIVNVLWLFWFYYILLSILLILYMIMSSVTNLTRKIKNVEDGTIKRSLSWMRLSLIGIFLSSLFPALLFSTDNILLTEIPYTLSSVFIFLFVISTFKSGIHVLLNQSQKRIIVATRSGIPIYGYTFNSFNAKSKLIAGSEDNTIFSGILKAITSLIAGFTGSEDKLIELTMEELTILVEEIDTNTFILLICNKPTLALRHKILAMKAQVLNKFTKIPKNSLRGHENKEMDNIIKSLFGIGNEEH